MMAQIGLIQVEHITQQAAHPPRGLSALVRHETIQNNNKPYSRDPLYPSIFNHLFSSERMYGIRIKVQGAQSPISGRG